MASRQAVGKSLRISKTSGSANAGATIRADAFVPKGFSAVLFPSFLSTSPNRECITRSCRPCFLSVRQMTLVSAGGITVAGASPCHAFHCLETASRNSSFSRPLKACHCFSLDQAAFTRKASCNNSDTLARAFSQTRLHSFLLFRRRLWPILYTLGLPRGQTTPQLIMHNISTFLSQDPTCPPVAHPPCDLQPLQPAVQRQADHHRRSRVN